MLEKLRVIISNIREKKGDAPLEKIREEDDLRNDIGFDSFDLAELTVHCEAEFNVDIFEDGIVTSIGEVLDKLHE
ncbi:MAG: phosphopantetheine-binding protein [bacterium]|nr:phosphopantetheine-binding protein [bacterium]